MSVLHVCALCCYICLFCMFVFYAAECVFIVGAFVLLSLTVLSVILGCLLNIWQGTTDEN